MFGNKLKQSMVQQFLDTRGNKIVILIEVEYLSEVYNILILRGIYVIISSASIIHINNLIFTIFY